MATYKDIRGTNVKTVSSDPPAPVNGQVWYNSTDQVMKGFTENPAGSWASGGNLNTARRALQGGGIQTSAIVFGGEINPGPTAGQTNIAESYDGTSWTEVADLNTARYNGWGVGQSNTAALGFGGYSTPAPGSSAVTELWNGSVWTELNDMNTARYAIAGGGTTTSALAFGGFHTSKLALNESWNGTSWTEVGDLNEAKNALGGTGGSNTSAIAMGGNNPGGNFITNTETWDGSSWTEVNNLNTGRQYIMGTGTQTAALGFAGSNPGLSALTELWNGSSWAEQNDLSTARQQLTGGGTTAASFGAGGYTPPTFSAATEEWTAPITNTVTFTAS